MAPTRPIESSQEWVEQSSLLLKAHPATTRISSKYSHYLPSKSKNKLKKSNSTRAPEGTDAATPTQPPQTSASFKLKTFDPVSGVCLVYQTDKAAEVGRLVAYLGSLGRSMCGLPEKVQDTVMADVGTAQEDDVAANTTVDSKAPAVSSGQQQGGGGGKKKKKGKK